MENSESFHSLQDYEKRAKETLTAEVCDYFSCGIERGWCLQDSQAAFSRYRIRSRVMRDVSNRTLSTTVLGQPIQFPICVAPSAVHAFAHKDAEKATAKGAMAAGTLMVQSSCSHTKIADVAAAAPGGLRWMQTYLFKDRLLTEHIVHEAERAGYRAIVVTVDSPHSGAHIRFTEELEKNPKFCLSNCDANIPSSNEAKNSGDTNFLWYTWRIQFNPAATWNDIRWLKSITPLPVVCKGILTAEAATEAADAGADGILVSAHGGRQMDGAPAPIDALAEVVSAVRDRDIEVYMDGGVRTGTDVFKALGRGARAVFVGRPILWGLASKGAEGVTDVLNILRDELDAVIAVSGCTSPSDIPPGAVVHESYYHRDFSKL